MISPSKGPLPSGSTDCHEGTLDVVAGAELEAVLEVALIELTWTVADPCDVGRLTAPFCRFGVELGAFELAVADAAADAVKDVVLAAHLPDRFFTFRFCLESVLFNASEPARCFLKSRLAGLAEPTKPWGARYALKGCRVSMLLAERSRAPGAESCRLEAANTPGTATRAVNKCLRCILRGRMRSTGRRLGEIR